MSYDYQTERPQLFTDAGQRMFIAIRDGVHRILDQSGAITLEKAMNAGRCTGNSWAMIACIDRMVELKELREVMYERVASNVRIFMKAQS